MKKVNKIDCISLLLIIIFLFGELANGKMGVEILHEIGNNGFYPYSKAELCVEYILGSIPIILPLLSILANNSSLREKIKIVFIRINSVVLLSYYFYLYVLFDMRNRELGGGLLLLIIANIIYTYYAVKNKPNEA